MPPKKIRASIIGVTGYTGLELLRLLLAHPHVEIGDLTSRQHDGEPVGNLYPHLAHLSHKITGAEPLKVAENSDIVFLCLPHKTAQDTVAALIGKTKIIDLSADFRLDDAETYQKYYGVAHSYPDLLKKVVYGLPETGYRDKIKGAETVANPGCFALLSQLLLYPFKGAIEHADIMAVTGSSGAGKSPGDGTHHPVRNHNMKSYNVNSHRHIPEIIRAGGITPAQLNFVPTSGPFTRGIFATAFVSTSKPINSDIVAKTYSGHPFIRLQKEVALANIVGSNYADLSVQAAGEDRFIVQGAIDNLIKGAGGTAVQNMNLMFGLEETAGLDILGPVYP
ncbi:MAG TPA: N-acetyl-gamma-glutamyl-phosphate reductase [Rhodospirillaceae bacterium]|nr:N-acetyl-gamma-glutamyl-phosphate reductase [Rhodospirillaceae bacterium]